MNRLLDNSWREYFKGTISLLDTLCPETMARKINEANVQQGFIYYKVMQLLNTPDKSILCVGSYEDTACEAMQKIGVNVTAIDPVINMSLSTFFKVNKNKFDIIFSTSVIEHVENDEQFIDEICKLLNSGGTALLTCDFREDYKEGDNKPGEDKRLYTTYDLTVRLSNILKENNCELIGVSDYSGEPDFVYGVHKYSFASFCFKKVV